MDNGSGKVIRRMGFKHPAGGKTGTTNSFRDAWFSGFTKDLTTSVWVGYDDNESMFRPNEKGVTGSHAAAPIWGLVMEKALEGREEVNFPVPTGIRFEYVNSSDGFYEPKSTKTNIRVAINHKQLLPRRPMVNFVASQTEKKLEVAQLNTKPALIHQNANSRVNANLSSSKLDTKIWFMLNLENAAMGKINKIPTSWFIKMLQDTRDIKKTSSERLSRGRKVLIEKLVSRIGSFENEVLEGKPINLILRPSEAKDYTVKYLAVN